MTIRTREIEIPDQTIGNVFGPDLKEMPGRVCKRFFTDFCCRANI